MARKPVNRAAIDEAAKALSNWGRWGAEDQIGTLNTITPQDVIDAGKLIRRGKVFSLGLSLKEPIQSGLFGGRWNPIHTMLATGTDAANGNQDVPFPYLRYADDAINMPCQASTQWDALCHIFLGDKMYNGFDARLVDAKGAKKLGIENYRDKMVGRGVLLDVARWKGVDSLDDGYPISNEDLDGCAKAQGVEVRRGDFVLVRTGHQERCLAKGDWSGYAGGDAPGVAFETCYWAREKDIAGLCTDTWGCEVRPNETNEANQPWHWVVIPAMGLAMGEIFYLKELAFDCASDGVYEFFFCAPPLHLPGGAGSPANPQAIK
ncbi:MAG: cyclase family protein [Alsobacter sp.]|jgi:kynurenine formamidase|nr:cyclase family protein [Burkholderiales bacterium]